MLMKLTPGRNYKTALSLSAAAAAANPSFIYVLWNATTTATTTMIGVKGSLKGHNIKDISQNIGKSSYMILGLFLTTFEMRYIFGGCLVMSKTDSVHKTTVSR